MNNHKTGKAMKQGLTKASRRSFRSAMTFLAAILLLGGTLFLPSACDLYRYGEVGGADMIFEGVLPPVFPGVWYSRYGDRKTDGYTIGWVEDLPLSGADLSVSSGYNVKPSDYYVYYDDLSQGAWGFSYMGIVRRVNIFNSRAGAIIIEYCDGHYPWWTDLSKTPFFGIYYRIIDNNTIQMANPIDLAALSQNRPYAVETTSLSQAIAKFTVANDPEFVSWGMVLPQERE
jgi:hypothetical protein